MIECKIEKVIKEEVYHWKGERFIKVRMSVSYNGHTVNTDQYFHVDEWKEAKEKGSYLL